jgi:hypothetical protein
MDEGWDEEALHRARIVEELRVNGWYMALELRIKVSYLIWRSSGRGGEDDNDNGNDEDKPDSEQGYVCTGIPI